MSRTKVELALGDVDLSADPSSYTWTDWTAYVELDGGAGVQLTRGYRDSSDDPSATEIRFRGKNTSLRWSLNNPNNPEFGRIRKNRTPIRVSHDPGTGASVRATAILTDVRLGYSTGVSGTYLWADVTAYGRLEREETAEVEISATTRQVSSESSIVYYVPGEDPSGSQTLESRVAGQPDVYAPGVNCGSDSSFPGTKALWTMGTNKIWAVVAPYAQPYPQQWTFLTAVRIPSEPAVETFIITLASAGGTLWFWDLYITPGSPASIRVAARAALSDLLTGTRTVNFTDQATGAELFGVPVILELNVIQNGTAVDWTVLINSTSEPSGFGQSGSVAAQTVGPITAISVNSAGGADGFTYGQWAIVNDKLGLTGVFWNGFKGDDTRLSWFTNALFAELPTGGSLANTVSTVGALATGKPVDAMKRAVRSEGGLMYEDPSGRMVMLARTELQNQSVALTIDRNNKQIADIQIIDDSLNAANQVTATSQGGASSTADAPSPNSPAEVGYTRNATLDVSLETDQQVKEAAQWDVAVRSFQDYRYVIKLRLASTAAALRATYLSSVDIGSRIQITNPQTSIVLDTIDQQVMGVTERLTEQEYDVALNTRPAGPWQVFVVENGSGNASRLDTAGCVLLADLTTSATSAIVATSGLPSLPAAKWSTSAVPYDLAIRTFDRVTCTAVANNASTFGAAGTAAHADNAAVVPGMPAGIVAGDLLLLLCSVRDSTGFGFLTGVADVSATFGGDQIGWKRLARFGGANGSFALYGRQYTTGLTAPTLTPTNTVAGDTVSAQMAGFRYAQPLAHAAALPLTNASAANITYPGLSPNRSGTVVLLIAQKDDDWTSLAAPAGFTKIGDPASTLGSDQGIGWFYQIQTTPTAVAAGSVVVTGGASATSKATMISLCGDAQTLTLTRAVNGSTAVPTHPAGSDVRLWRVGRISR